MQFHHNKKQIDYNSLNIFIVDQLYLFSYLIPLILEKDLNKYKKNVEKILFNYHHVIF